MSHFQDDFHAAVGRLITKSTGRTVQEVRTVNLATSQGMNGGQAVIEICYLCAEESEPCYLHVDEGFESLLHRIGMLVG